ncbi:MAG: polyhydroxyalkanoate depolymerase [Alphaproteobacteria bacterium]|nr:polyhydroxyalkanoate depolymerase [Alphaproteobacteria bacterium]
MRDSRLLWAGRIMTGLFALFMLGASVAPKLLGMPVAEQTLAALGWPAGYAVMIGIIELSCTLLYLIPRTSLLGAVAMTALLGGAIATQIRAGSPLFSHILFGVYLGLFMWGGLWLRDPALRALLPYRRKLAAEEKVPTG